MAESPTHAQWWRHFADARTLHGARVSTGAVWLRVAASLTTAIALALAVLCVVALSDPMFVVSSPLILADLYEALFWCVICLMVSVPLALRRKRPLLFLRKFGNAGWTAQLEPRLRSSCGWLFRLVTLDDAVYPPTGVHASTLVAALVFAAAAGFVGWSTHSTIATMLQDQPQLWMSVLPYGVVLTEVLFALSTWFVVIVAFTQVCGWRFLRFRIHRERDLEKVAEYVKKSHYLYMSPPFASPRAIVVRVETGRWKDAVERLVSVAGVVMIDVSRPSANILWELDECLRQRRLSLLLLGETRLVEEWLQHGADRKDPVLAALRERTAGLPLLTYSSAERLDVKALRLALQAIASAPTLARPRRQWIRECVGLAIWPAVFVGILVIVVMSFPFFLTLPDPWTRQ